VLKLKDGRKELYQWDVGDVADVTIDNIDEVHFSNLRFGKAFNIAVKDKTVEIPPEVLQSGADVFCWAFVRKENGGYTKKEQIFNVEKRPRPADYVFEPTDILSWETLNEKKEDKTNKLTEYTKVDTDKEYYSAKATNEMFLALNQVFDIYDEAYNEKFATKTELEALKSELQGDIDSIFALVGGAE
jgi:hypothetical protein